MMKVTMLLADFAQALQGKLYVMGGGWNMTGPIPSPSALAIKVDVPWNEANRKHNLRLELLDGDFHPVLIPTPNGNSPMIIAGDFEAGRPPGAVPGVPLSMPFAFNLGPVPLAPGQRYVWKLFINGNSNDDWQVAFSTREANAPPVQM